MAATEADLLLYSLPAFQRVTARNNAELTTLLARERPLAVVIDGDLPGLDAAAACAAARSHDGVSVLVTAGSAEQVPPFLKAGCHAILLKPFAPNLFVGRMGRLLRERAQQPRGAEPARSAALTQGTNRAWETVECPRCSEPNAVSFDFTSHRRMWFACLACDQVWIGHRQE